MRIAKRTAKFVFVLSRASNKKAGTLDELNCALGVEKKLATDGFILTLKLDDLPFEDVYINIQRRRHSVKLPENSPRTQRQAKLISMT